MRKFHGRALWCAVIGAVGLFGMGCRVQRVQVAALPDFDLERYLGKWYEIARLDHFFERGLDSVSACYTLREDGKVGVLNRGYDPGRGEWRDARGKAVRGEQPNFLRVYFVPLIGGDYQVAYLDSAYRTAVVSGGTTNYLWFLSRTPRISEQQLEPMKRVAEALGYSLGELIYPAQPALREKTK